MSIEVKKIGNQLNLSRKSDPNRFSTNKFRRMMTVFDLFPVNADFSMDGVFDKDKGATFKIKYLYDEEIKSYQKICKSYGLDDKYAAIRLYTTEQTQVQEDITNEFQDSLIEQKVNELSDLAKQAFGNAGVLKAFAPAFGKGTQDTLKALGIDLNADSISNAINAGGNFAYGVADTVLQGLGIDKSWSQSVSGQLDTIVRGSAEVILQGKSFSLPKSWRNATYEPNLNVSVVLVSPYGTPEAIKQFIIEPLLYLLLLIAPVTVSGVTFGDTRKLNILGFGSSNMSYAYCESLSLSRNKTNIGFNAFKQPLSVELNLVFRPLLPSFASVNKFRSDGNNTDGDPVGTIKRLRDRDFTLYLEDVSSGMNTVGNTIKSLAPIIEDEVLELVHSCENGYLSTAEELGLPVFNTVESLIDQGKELIENIEEVISENIAPLNPFT